jgi:hypothetical protein
MRPRSQELWGIRDCAILELSDFSSSVGLRSTRRSAGAVCVAWQQIRQNHSDSELLTQLSQLRTFFGFFVMIFVPKSCVLIIGI